MSAALLPLHIDPLRLAKTGARLHGSLPMAGMERLGSLLAAKPGDVTLSLTFDLDPDLRVAVLHLQLQAELELSCQRCLDTLKHPVAIDRRLGVVMNELQAEQLPEEYEPLLATPEPLFLRDVIEDELILCLPIVPRHAEHVCGLKMKEETLSETATSHPFAALAELKNTD